MGRTNFGYVRHMRETDEERKRSSPRAPEKDFLTVSDALYQCPMSNRVSDAQRPMRSNGKRKKTEIPRDKGLSIILLCTSGQVVNKLKRINFKFYSFSFISNPNAKCIHGDSPFSMYRHMTMNFKSKNVSKKKKKEKKMHQLKRTGFR